MFKFIKKIKELEKRISVLENALATSKTEPQFKNQSSTYEEVIDEWLNGKRQ